MAGAETYAEAHSTASVEAQMKPSNDTDPRALR
jgi:hypothetical protein